MGFRAWIGLWTCLILIIIVLTDCSALVKYITRFTGKMKLLRNIFYFVLRLMLFLEESFASLIAFIFIKESFFKLLEIRKSYKYSSDPSIYINDYLNNSNCNRCVRKLISNQTQFELSNFTAITKQQVRNYFISEFIISK